MVQTSGRWRSGDKHRAFIPVVVIVAVLVIGVSVFMFLRTTTPTTTVSAITPALPPQSVRQWRIDFAESKKLAHFDASYRPGQVCYIPAGSVFSVKAEPHG